MPGPDRERSQGEDSPDTPERSLWFGVVGAVIGGAVGYAIFCASLKYASMYTLVIPGALIGLGRVVGTKTISIPLGIVCGVFALVLSLGIEWQFILHPGDESITDFLMHLHEKPFRNVASLIAGPVLAVWFGVGRRD